MKPAAIEAGLVEALRNLDTGSKPDLAAIRRGIGCSLPDLRSCIQSMRFKGKLHWERLELAGSLLLEPKEYPGASGTAREASSGSSSDEPTRITDRVPLEREQVSAVPAAPAPICLLPDNPNGNDLANAIRAEAARRGVPIASLVAQLRPGNPNKYIEQLVLSHKPTASTVERIRALLAGEPLPPLDPSRRGVNTTASTQVSAERHAADRDEEQRRKRDGFRAYEVRRPGESVADAAKRAAEAGLLRATGTETEARKAVELDQLSTPSSLLQRAQRDWPQHCLRARALAEATGESLGAIWERVLGAGLLAVEEDLREEAA